MKTTFSVVIPTWNRKSDLAEAVASLTRQEGVTLEIIVIDNGSTDETQVYCNKLADEDKRFRYFRFDTNQGIVAAENKGFSEARGNIIFCMDDDELAQSNNLLQTVEKLAEEKCWDLLSIGCSSGASDAEHENVLFPQLEHLPNGFYVNNFGNGAVFIKRQVIERIGVFEEHYFRQGHENEYALRAILHGFTILHYPRLILKHKFNPLRPPPQTVAYYMLRNTLLKNHKYFSGTRLFMLQLWQISQFLGRTLAGKISPKLIVKALNEYNRMKKSTCRILDYTPAAMRRYFFMSRKAVSNPESIGELSFCQYYVRGLNRFLKPHR